MGEPSLKMCSGIFWIIMMTLPSLILSNTVSTDQIETSGVTLENLEVTIPTEENTDLAYNTSEFRTNLSKSFLPSEDLNTIAEIEIHVNTSTVTDYSSQSDNLVTEISNTTLTGITDNSFTFISSPINPENVNSSSGEEIVPTQMFTTSDSTQTVNFTILSTEASISDKITEQTFDISTKQMQISTATVQTSTKSNSQNELKTTSFTNSTTNYDERKTDSNDIIGHTEIPTVYRENLNLRDLESTINISGEIFNPRDQSTVISSERYTDIAYEKDNRTDEAPPSFVEYRDSKEMSINEESIAYARDRNYENYPESGEESFRKLIEVNRNPKRIVESKEKQSEVRARPARPDPGYADRYEPDLVRPYRPDTPLHQYPYYRPTPDYRTPIIRQDTGYTRPARPDPDYQRFSFKPNYSYSRPSYENKTSTQQPTVRPYRPTFNRPYYSQSSFGRPYRPDYQRPASFKPNEDNFAYKSSIPPTSGVSYLDSEVSEHSRADYDYTRQSESSGILSQSSNHMGLSQNAEKSNLYKPFSSSDSNSYSHYVATDENISKDHHITTSTYYSDLITPKPYDFHSNSDYSDKPTTSQETARPFSSGLITSSRNLTKVEFIKADCFDNHMKVTIRFNGTFNGLVYSSGYAQDSSCSYVNGSGRNHYEFFIRLNRCGTLGQQEVAEQNRGSSNWRRQNRAQYLVNTVTVQYNPVIEEDIDEHFRVTCEYGYDFWKTVTFPMINVESGSQKMKAGSPVVFTLPPPQCNMEIRSGFGPSGNRITGPVNVGDHLTLVIHMKSESAGFDILVSNCFAHNGAKKRLQLIDANGCVLQHKLIEPFKGVTTPDRSQQVTLYSYLKAFRFTGSPALYIECDVHMCHGTCPPQRCYWRNLRKRSADELSTPRTTTETGVISESVSLFQALEVRHQEADTSFALRTKKWPNEDDMVCIRTGGFTAIAVGIFLLLLISLLTTVCLCCRVRKLKLLIAKSGDSYSTLGIETQVPLQ